MTEFLKDWVTDLASISLVCACALSLAPEGGAKRAMKLICAAVTVMVTLSPLGNIDFSFAAEAFDEFKSQAVYVSEDFNLVNEKIAKDIIEEETETYISDKGQKLGLSITEIRVTAKKREDGYYYPYSAEITCYPKDERFGDYITDELGIENDKIIWK